jgi:predicted secreted protein
MGWVSGLAVYAIIWWLLIFMILPWGIRPIGREDVDKGQDAGAPWRPHLGPKIALNSALSGVVWGIVYVITEMELVSFRVP